MRKVRFIIPFILISCSPLYFRMKIEYTGECTINKKEIISELRRQKVQIKKIELSDYHKYSEQCNCLIMGARAIDWEGVSTFGSDLFFPIFRLDESYYINTFYIDGNLREGFEKTEVDQYIEDALKKLEKKKPYCFSDSLYHEYKNVFERGLSRSYRGYIFWQ